MAQDEQNKDTATKKKVSTKDKEKAKSKEKSPSKVNFSLSVISIFSL